MNIFNEMSADIQQKFSDRIISASGFTLKKIVGTIIYGDVFQPLCGSSYIDLPEWIKNKKVCINIQNEDNKCILYTIFYLLNKNADVNLKTDPQRISKYKNYLTELENDKKYRNLNITYPFEITDDNVKKLEDYFNITINFYEIQDKIEIDEQKIQLLRRSLSFTSDDINKTHLDILYLENSDNSHFVAINNLSGFFRGIIHKYTKNIPFICRKCFKKNFKTEDGFNIHKMECYKIKTKDSFIPSIDLPNSENNKVKYTSKGAEVYHPYVVYLDFESTLTKISEKTKKTEKIHEHIPNSFALYNNYSHETIIEFDNNPDDLMKKFQQALKIEATKWKEKYYEFTRNSEKRKVDDDSYKKYKNTNKCEICDKEFGKMYNGKIIEKNWDHDHATSLYRMALCNSCNSICKIPKFLPIVVHNLRGYDSKFIIKFLNNLKTFEKSDTDSEVKVVANTTEKFRQISKVISIGLKENEMKKCNSCNYENYVSQNTCYKCNESVFNETYIKTVDDVVELRFIDSYEFLSTSLEKAVKDLLDINNGECLNCNKTRELKEPQLKVFYSDKTNTNYIYACETCTFCNSYEIKKKAQHENFVNVKKFFGDDWHDLCYFLRKGIYPYEWVDNFDKLNSTEFPKYEDFYSNLSGSNISQKDYEFGKKFWNYFNIQDFKEYHAWYLKLDTVLLADVFDNFRKMCYQEYMLDPIHFISAPHLSFAAALKLTKVEIELLTDEKMYEFFEKGVRGGISHISHSYAIANNCHYYDEKLEKVFKLTKEEAIEKGIYNQNKPTSYIEYLDANNLYGWAMSQKLPVRNHQWLNENELSYFSNIDNIKNCDTDGDFSYILEVNLEIPEELHDKFNDYSPAPNHENPTILSSFQKFMIENKLGTKPNKNIQKLLCSLEKKENYVINLCLLKEYANQGVKINKIHRGIKSEQEAWLKEYIDKNTELRKNAKNDFQKNFFKLMNNSNYGKQMENVRKRTDVKIVNSSKMMKKLLCKSNYENRTIIEENLVIVSGKKKTIKLNKPIFGGQAILDISKVLMFKYYVYLKNKYGDKMKLLATDTDSFIIYVESENEEFDFYEEEIKNNINQYDTSEFINDEMPKNNKKIPGKFKDEYNGIPIRKFCGLRSKMYTLETDNSLKTVAKGINKSNKNRLEYEDYKKCLDNIECKEEECYNIRSRKLKLYTIKETKVGLSPYDDKFYFYKDSNGNFDKLAYGHYKIKQLEKT